MSRWSTRCRRLATSKGTCDLTFVWAALDCPTFFTRGPEGTAAVVARLTEQDAIGCSTSGIRTSSRAGIVDSDGRKHHSACANLDSPTGMCSPWLGVLWIELKDASSFGAT